MGPERRYTIKRKMIALGLALVMVLALSGMAFGRTTDNSQTITFEMAHDFALHVDARMHHTRAAVGDGEFQTLRFEYNVDAFEEAVVADVSVQLVDFTGQHFTWVMGTPATGFDLGLKYADLEMVENGGHWDDPDEPAWSGVEDWFALDTPVPLIANLPQHTHRMLFVKGYTHEDTPISVEDNGHDEHVRDDVTFLFEAIDVTVTD